ncbi:MAG TPA: AMP-binding protein [Gammaproteobacteria bacterium]|jgi:acetyl-CoA synthetase|nr:AMP-binding protein [Gammaproteobacteria bacterium]
MDLPEQPDWRPDQKTRESAHLTKLMSLLNISDVRKLHQWSTQHYEDFWQYVVDTLPIQFKTPPNNICDLSKGVTSPQWFPGAQMNIVDSCFKTDARKTAIIYLDEQHHLCTLSYGELEKLVNQIANSLIHYGVKPKEAIAIIMPMHFYAIALYLAIIKIGAVVVSIADSFSSEEITTRLSITKTSYVFTQDFFFLNQKKYCLQEKVQAAIQACDFPISCIVLNAHEVSQKPHSYRTTTHDTAQPLLPWRDFLIEKEDFTSIACEPMSACNILFSSGTTAKPKAIVWNHTTPIRAASDAFFHQNIQPQDVLAWPTNLGWMMGPWLIFAALINHASIAVYTDTPKDCLFGNFIQQAGVTMLGVVPTLVAAWRQTACMENLDWTAIKVFSSTGECSNPADMRYLMALAGHKPIIEYCGGTEIGGAYLSSTVIQDNYASLFSTPTMGTAITLLDEHGRASHEGEVAVVPPAIGLSTVLLNANHDEVYFAHMPKTENGHMLRRHGDAIKALPHGYYMLLGRVDDTMNLGGIKISAAEIERALIGIPGIKEIAAIATQQHNQGPDQLIIFASTTVTLNKEEIRSLMQKKISAALNPLFKIHDVVFLAELPKTASQKIMRRKLRESYHAQEPI